MIAINSTIDIKAMYFQFYYSYVQTNTLMSDQPLKWSNIRSEDYSILIGSTALSPLTCISQKTGMRFVKKHDFYKNRPSKRSTSANNLLLACNMYILKYYTLQAG